MASKKRNYQAFVPVAITMRCILRLPFLAQLQLQELMLTLLTRYAERCGVEICWYDLRPNHLHVTAWQTFDGHDQRRRVGISPWMRNVLSVWVKKANAFYSTQGGLTERTFLSYNISSNQHLLANQAYTLGNKAHHIGESPADDPSGAWSVYAKAEPDGVVNAVPSYLDQLGPGPTDELLLAIIWRAVELEALKTKRAWLVATQEILAERAPTFPAMDLPGSYHVVTIVDADKHRTMVADRLTREWKHVKFQPRKAPSISEAIEILNRKNKPPAPPFG